MHAIIARIENSCIILLTGEQGLLGNLINIYIELGISTAEIRLVDVSNLDIEDIKDNDELLNNTFNYYFT